MKTNGQWLTVNQACFFIGVSRATFYRSGYPVEKRENGRAYYLRKHLQMFIDNKGSAKHPGAVSRKNRKQKETFGQHHGVGKEETVNPLLLTKGDVCALLNVSRTTLYRLEKSGDLPGRLMLGGHVRYDRELIEK
jgi:excisionase family DNA binding protein